MTARHGERRDAPIDEPAPTVSSHWRSDEWVVDRRTVSRGAGGGRVATAPVAMTEPAPTITTKSVGQWVLSERQPHGATRQPHEPSMTITASADNGNYAFVGERGRVKIDVTDALVLQSFRRDYPLRGPRSAEFLQVGNAMPPVLGIHVVAAVTGLDESRVLRALATVVVGPDFSSRVGRGVMPGVPTDSESDAKEGE